MTTDFDFFFLSYDEPFADGHLALLTSKFPAAKRVSGVKGVHEAVFVAAERSSAVRFFLLDADGVLDDRFRIELPPEASKYSMVVWRARNDAVGLQYGHGGLKLYDVRDLERTSSDGSRAPQNRRNFRKQFDGASGTTACYLEQVANANHFNKSPLTAWRGAFRECFKLAFEQLHYGETQTAAEWLSRWCHPHPDAENSKWIRLGARDAVEAAHRDPDRWLRVINDFDALSEIFADEVGLAT